MISTSSFHFDKDFNSDRLSFQASQIAKFKQSLTKDFSQNASTTNSQKKLPSIENPVKTLQKDQDFEEDDGENPVPLPHDSQVLQLQKKKKNCMLHKQLEKTKSRCESKKVMIKSRIETLNRKRVNFLNMFEKYNDFVLERNSSVEGEETGSRSTFSNDIDSVKIQISNQIRKIENLQKLLDLLDGAIHDRCTFQVYLKSVIDAKFEEMCRYQDIEQLMNRCEILVLTKQKSLEAIQNLESTQKLMKSTLKEFREAKSEKILKLMAEQSSLQERLYEIQSKRTVKHLEMKRCEDIKVDREVTLANIQLEIFTLFKYAKSQVVVIPTPKKYFTGERVKFEKKVVSDTDYEGQMETVEGHIQDLKCILALVHKFAKEKGLNVNSVNEVVSYSEDEE